MTLHLGFTGSSRAVTPAQFLAIDRHLRSRQGWTVHHGDCVAADYTCHLLAKSLGMAVVIHPPSNPKKRAWCAGADRVELEAPYLKRNGHIVAAAHELLACPDTEWEQQRSGTWSTIRRARKKGIPIAIIRPDGTVAREHARCAMDWGDNCRRDGGPMACHRCLGEPEWPGQDRYGR